MARFKYQDYRNKLSYYLPYMLAQDDGLLLNSNGTLQKIIRFRGYDLDVLTTAELDALDSRINNVIKRVNGGWTLHFECKRKKINEYCTSEYDILAPKLIEDERKKQFSNGDYYESEYYLSFVYLPASDSKRKIIDLFFEKTKTNDTKNEEISNFSREVKNMIAMLKSNMLEVEELTTEETYIYLHSNFSTKKMNKINISPIFISNSLCDSHMTGGMKPTLNNKHVRAISINGFPISTNSNFFKKINDLNIEYRWTSRFIALDKAESLKKMEDMWNQLYTGQKSILQMVSETITKKESVKINAHALEEADKVDAQINLVRADYLSEGYYTNTIIIMDESETEVDKKMSKISEIINGLGFITIEETTNTVQAFLGSQPGNIGDNIRIPIVNSMTLTHLLPISATWTGEKYNKFLNGPPLIYAATSGNTPFIVNFQNGDIQHGAIIGRTGFGKSVLLGMIAASYTKYKNSRVYFFDKDGSSRVLTYAMGGNFYDLGKDKLSFQPLRNIGLLETDLDKKTGEYNTLRADLELDWANGWIIDILEQEKLLVTPEVKKKVYDALKGVADMPLNLRTMTTFVSVVTSFEIKEALASFITGGAVGRYFDADSENMSISRWNVFEMGEIIENKQAITPLLTYLFHKIDTQLDSTTSEDDSSEYKEPTLIILDECWMFFDNPTFAEKMKNWLKTLRKKKAGVIFATQELKDVINSPIFSTIVEACNTKIFLSNPDAMQSSEVYEKFGLNMKAIEMISKGTPKRDYFFESPQGARLFNMNLQEITLKLIASSSTEAQARAIKIKQELEEIESYSADNFTKKWLGYE